MLKTAMINGGDEASDLLKLRKVVHKFEKMHCGGLSAKPIGIGKWNKFGDECHRQ